MYHCLINLQALIKEAIYLNRIPVIMPPLLHSKHNFGISLYNHWPKYLNIAQTEVYIKDNGKFEQTPKPFVFILEEDLKKLKFQQEQVRKIDPYYKITEAENRKWQLIVRSVNQIFFGRWQLAFPKTGKKIRVKFAWSNDVVNRTKKISESLGCYAAIHVRRGDRLKMNKKLKKFTSPKHIFNTMKNIVPLKSNIYILTDEKDKHFFDYLRKHYKIYQYFDFDDLTTIISGHEPDNHFLYLVERCIFENAAIKIGTFKSSHSIIWSGGDYYLSKYNRVQYSTSYKLKSYFALVRSFLKGFGRHPFSFKSKYNTFRRLTRELFRNFKPQKN
jgi:hypothetical protein